MELKKTKKDKKQWAVVDDLKQAVWLLKIEIENKDREHKSLIKMASKNLAQLSKQAARITELEAQRDELLIVCKAALERCPFPVGAMAVKEQLRTIVQKYKEIKKPVIGEAE